MGTRQSTARVNYSMRSGHNTACEMLLAEEYECEAARGVPYGHELALSAFCALEVSAAGAAHARLRLLSHGYRLGQPDVFELALPEQLCFHNNINAVHL